MDLQEALAALSAEQTKVNDLTSQNTSILAKNQEILGKLRTAKDERDTLNGSFESLKSEFETFKNQSGLDDEQKQKVNDLVSQGIEAKQAEFETTLDDLTTKLNDSEGRFTKLKSKYDVERIDGAIRAAAEKTEAVPDGIDDIILRSRGIFSIGENDTIEARDSDGNLVKAGKRVLTPDVFVENLKETAIHLWPQSQGSGANGSGSGGAGGPNPFAKETLNYTEQAKMMKSDPVRAQQLKEAAAS